MNTTPPRGVATATAAGAGDASHNDDNNTSTTSIGMGSIIYKDFDSYLGILQGRIIYVSENHSQQQGQQPLKKFSVKWEHNEITSHTYEELLTLQLEHIERTTAAALAAASSLQQQQQSQNPLVAPQDMERHSIAVAAANMTTMNMKSPIVPKASTMTTITTRYSSSPLSPDTAVIMAAAAAAAAAATEETNDTVDDNDIYRRIIIENDPHRDDDEEDRDNNDSHNNDNENFSALLKEAEKFVIEQNNDDVDDDELQENGVYANDHQPNGAGSAKKNQSKKAMEVTKSKRPRSTSSKKTTTPTTKKTWSRKKKLSSQHPPIMHPDDHAKQLYPVGTIVRKEFQQLGIFYGIIIEYSVTTLTYLVQYEDNEIEEYDHYEIVNIVYYSHLMNHDDRVIWEQHKLQPQPEQQNEQLINMIHSDQLPKIVLFEYKVNDNNSDDDPDDDDQKIKTSPRKSSRRSNNESNSNTKSSKKQLFTDNNNNNNNDRYVLIISCSSIYGNYDLKNYTLESLKVLSNLWKNSNMIRKLANEAIQDMKYPIGTAVRKQFGDYKWYNGIVISYDKDAKYYKVRYTDNEIEEYYEHELVNILVLDDNDDNDASSVDEENYNNDDDDDDEEYLSHDDIVDDDNSDDDESNYAANDNKKKNYNNRTERETRSCDVVVATMTTTPKYKNGTRVSKGFGNYGSFEGTIVQYDTKLRCYHVKYDDGDSEDLNEKEINEYVIPQEKNNNKKKKNHSRKLTGDRIYVRKYGYGSEVIQFFHIDNMSFVGDVVHFNPHTGKYSVIFENGNRRDYGEQELEYIMTKPKYPPAIERNNNDIRQQIGGLNNKGNTRNGTTSSSSKNCTCRYPNGTIIEKAFPGFGLFRGKVVAFDPPSGLYSTVYDDGDKEDMNESEIEKLVVSKPTKSGNQSNENSHMNARNTATINGRASRSSLSPNHVRGSDRVIRSDSKRRTLRNSSPSKVKQPKRMPGKTVQKRMSK